MAEEQVLIRGFRHELEIYRIDTGEIVDRLVVFNKIPQVGIDFLAQTPFGDVASISTFYCGLFRNNVVPATGWTSADIPTTMGEFVAYSEASRPIWQRAYNGAGSMTNGDSDATKAVFTPTAEATVYGSFIVSTSQKGSGTGLLLSAARFPTARQLVVGEAAKLTCGLSYIPGNQL